MLLTGSIKDFQELITVSMLCATLTNRGRHCRGTRTRLEVTACRSIRPDQRRLSTRNCCALSSPFSRNPSIVTLQNISLVLQSDRFPPEQATRSSPEVYKCVSFSPSPSQVESAPQGVFGSMLLKMSMRLSSPHR